MKCYIASLLMRSFHELLMRSRCSLLPYYKFMCYMTS